MKKIKYLQVLFILTLTIAIGVFGQSSLTSVEKGSAVYNAYVPPGFPEMDHGGIFIGFDVENGSWRMKWVEVGSSSSSSCDFGGGENVFTKTADLHSWQRLTTLTKTITTDETILDLFRSHFVDYMKCGTDAFRGSYTVDGALHNGTYGPNERNSVANTGQDIYDRAYAPYTAMNMLNAEKYWSWDCSCYQPWDHDITSTTNMRCDLIPEWSYEKNNFLVWTNPQAPTLGNITTDFDAIAKHNDFWNGNYQGCEVVPIIQHGGLVSNGRDSKNYTTMRPEAIERPTLFYIGMNNGSFNISGEENASQKVYVALMYSNDNVNWNWVVDNNGTTWKYTMLYGTVESTCRTNLRTGKNHCKRLIYDFYLPVNPWTKYNCRYVKTVVVDEGANYSSYTLDKNLGEDDWGVYYPLQQNLPYKIVSAMDTNYCIDIAGPVYQNGQPIHLWQYFGGANQKWNFISAGQGYYNIVSSGSQSFGIDDPFGTLTNGTQLQIWTVVGNDQQWYPQIAEEGGSFYIVPKSSNPWPYYSLIDLDYGTPSNDGKIQIWQTGSGINQKWRIIEAE